MCVIQVTSTFLRSTRVMEVASRDNEDEKKGRGNPIEDDIFRRYMFRVWSRFSGPVVKGCNTGSEMRSGSSVVIAGSGVCGETVIRTDCPRQPRDCQRVLLWRHARACTHTHQGVGMDWLSHERRVGCEDIKNDSIVLLFNFLCSSIASQYSSCLGCRNFPVNHSIQGFLMCEKCDTNTVQYRELGILF